MKDVVRTPKGVLNIKLFDADGNVIQESEEHNLIVNSGIALMAGLLDGSQTAYINAIAIGTGTTAPATSQTALVTEVMRVGSTNSLTTTSVTNDTAQFVSTFSFSSSYAITEAGLFNSTTASSGTMLSRVEFSAYNVVSGNSMQITYTVQF